MMLRFVPRVLAGVLVCLVVLLTGCSSTTGTSGTSGTTGGRSTAATPAWVGDLATVQASQLPAEARQTLALIDKGGPFPYARDGVVFGNYEGLLPGQQRGYYHEYTVRTPGSRDRGARRIVTGQGGEIYYTDDHYESFRAVLR
ncbi:ribonuclease domain-containing protein [Streptomyces sp. NBC_00078]|uniref:ribonuclease domain-containing protein n=1 Tax=unclassified Streptomyces TaxID=2593676 RepID=UPI002255E877|nr:ribonuclease domain-containing protein [Streptomyces sp. NBC_00078]MCX5419430.1 ribonuclease N [Streptomyces sp. NBC_00078]